MLLLPDDWLDKGYSRILSDCRNSHTNSHNTSSNITNAIQNNGKTLILCHADVDAMAAARILTYMLRADQVEYVLQSCMSFGKLQQILAKQQASPFAAIVLLNVGGTRNLTKLFGGGNNNNSSGLDLEATSLYVLDGRRPIHLANVHAGDHVNVFFETEAIDSNYFPSDGDNLSGNSSDEQVDSSSDDDDASSTSDDGLSDSDEDDDNDDGEMEMEFDTVRGFKKDKKTEVVVDADAMEEDEDIDYDGEDEGDGRITPQKNKKKTNRRTTDQQQQQQEQDSPGTAATEELDEGEDGDDDLAATPTDTAGTAPTQASTVVQHPQSPAARHRARQDKLRTYYAGGSSYGVPSAFIAYSMSSQLRFGAVPDLLWLCMVGVTDAFLQARLGMVPFIEVSGILKDDCDCLFPPPDEIDRVETTVYAEDLLVSGASQSRQKTKLTFSDHGSIRPQKDFKFFLLRHSSLLDALQLSPYVSTQLQLWTKPGMQRLMELLARMGFPLEECKHPYAFLRPSLRRRLPLQLMEYAEEFGLDQLEFTSFVRVTGFKSVTSASDVCYAASALLECPIVSATDAAKSNTAGAEQQQEDFDQECFQAAYDALGHMPSPGTSMTGSSSSNNSRKTNAGNIDTGIKWAIQLQRLILGTAVGLVTRNAITRLRHFRYAYITVTSQATNHSVSNAANPQDTSSSNSNSSKSKNAADQQYHVLAKPLALTRLAHYLMDMHRANGKWVGEKNTRPLVLLAEQPATNTFLVVGYEMSEEQGHLRNNRFGQHFGLVAQTMANANANEDGTGAAVEQVKAVARLESFDAHVVEVAASHAQRFLEQLHYIMDSV